MRTIAASLCLMVAWVLTLAAQVQSPPVFRSGAISVSVAVSVQDRNQPVPGLEASDFVLYDRDQRQTIDSASLGAVPIDVTLFLGTNNQSSRAMLADLNTSIKEMVALLRPADRVRLLTLGNQVNDAFGWRSSDDPGVLPDVRVGGIQSFYDGCFLALMHRPDPERRHVVIAISDGVEFGSVVDSTTVLDAARQADAVMHLVFVERDGPRFILDRRKGTSVYTFPSGAFLRTTWLHVLPDLRGIERLEEAAEATGGTARHTSSPESVVDTFTRVFNDFRQSYVLRYTPTGVDPKGWHDLRVELANGRKYTLRARKGYFGG
ncbi:MAG TPA: hypothetical protein VLD67_21645 [Vicinamibacterales bacterium]|nr:hypothetical protein [Vicinamibacterales bacterium]